MGSVIEAIDNAQLWLQEAKRLAESQPETLSEATEDQSDFLTIAWGSQVSPTFKERVVWIAETLRTRPDYLMACMAFESAETFRSDIKNAAGSGATGLIQFMPATARSLGTTTTALAKLSPEDQLNYVYRYFKPYAGKLNNLGDVYMAILWPAAVGKADHYVLFDRRKAPTAFRQNAGLDKNKDGLVTRAECLGKINEKLAKGLSAKYIG